MKTLYRYLTILICVSAAWLTHAQQLTVIELKYRPADELIPVLRPLLDGETSLSGIDYRLLVRGSGADLARIREALAVLDRAPKQLTISARYATRTDIATEQDSVTGRIGSDGARIAVNATRDRDSIGNGNVSSVRVMEGQAAFIASGQSVPMVSAALVNPRSGNVGAIIEQRELATGFRVLPRVNGDTVILDIGAQQERLNTANSIAAQRVNTSVSGRMGQWLPVAAVEENSRSENTALIARRTQTASDRRELWIKVDLIAQ